MSFSIADTTVENLSSAEGALNVNLTGNALNNVLTEDAGTNILNGGLGADTLNGGEGDDVYYVDDVNDVVTEAESGGHDKIYATIKGFTASNVEEVIYIGPEEPPVVTPPVVTPPVTPVFNENERIVGTAGKDTLYGLNGDDTILGGGGNDYLDGGAGNDLLYGGIGKDTLKGGLGRDVFVFVFDTKSNKKTNMDKIADFNVKDDTIYLDNKSFKALGKNGSITKPAKMSSKMFYSGSKAHDKDDRIIYDKKKGVLYYYDDGIGSHKAVEIATLKKGLKLTYHDFFVI